MSFKKDEEGGGFSYFQDKSSVLQEARVFNESPISPRKCRILLTKIVYLLYTGETFSRQEATQLFFSVTKLFQHKDSALRQMVYLVIKELSSSADDVIMVTSSIMKDMQPNLEVIYRPNAIRALSRIVDPSMMQGLERFFKAAIVDRNTSISSAALVSSYHMHVVAREVIKRWGNEAQEAINSKTSTSPASFGLGGASSYLGFGGSGGSSGSSGGGSQAYQAVPSSTYITQYHALGLLYLIRQGDRMAVTKLIQQLSGGKAGNAASGASSVLRSPYALCMLIRYAVKVGEEDLNMQHQMRDLLDGWLRHKSDMVNYEAARAICEMRGVTAQDLMRPIAVLQLFLSSPKSTLKFAAIRTLAKLAQTHPQVVQACNLDMENLITDPNRSVATYAITTLLKTGNETSVDRLMKQISGFMNEISDEFKIIVVDAIRSLCLKFPSKQAVMLNFLSGVLRDEGGYDFKRAVVEAIFDMVRFISDCKEAALAHLCEFIEDCEFTKLSVRILHLLGMEGPKSPQPHKYIRYIYNRVILENAIVRAAAVTSLAKFGIGNNEEGGRTPDSGLRTSIGVLLTRCLDDVDDEVRDRAAMYLRVLKEEQLAETFVRDEATFSLSGLEAQLQAYISDTSAQDKGFDISAVPKISREQARQEALRAKSEATANVAMAADDSKPVLAAGAAPAAPANAAEAQSLYAKQLAEVPELEGYGPVIKSSAKPVDLTEKETEYVVTAVKHIFAKHIVFQFNVSNTLPDTVLEQVMVLMQGAEDAGLKEGFIIPVPQLMQENSPAPVYVSFTRLGAEEEGEGSVFPIGAMQNTLRFVSKEVDPSSGEPEEEGYEDEYQVEDIELGVGDYILPTYATFATEWEKLEASASATETFALTALESLQAACDTIIELLNMEALGGTGTPTSSSVHTLNLSGLVAGGGGKVLVRARMTFQTGDGVTMELAVRAEMEEAIQLVLSAIA